VASIAGAMKELAPVAKPSPIAATSPRLMRTTCRHLLHLGSVAPARQGVQNRLTAELTPNDQPAPARRCLMDGLAGPVETPGLTAPGTETLC
jgi:hypothetical protein